MQRVCSVALRLYGVCFATLWRLLSIVVLFLYLAMLVSSVGAGTSSKERVAIITCAFLFCLFVLVAKLLPELLSYVMQQRKHKMQAETLRKQLVLERVPVLQDSHAFEP